MPLIRAARETPETTRTEPAAPWQERLASPDPDERRRAARALSTDPATASALADRLEREPELVVRDALFASLVVIGGSQVASLVAPLLRSEDAGLRGGAIEALKRLGEAAVTALDGLLDDSDPDVRILAIEVTRVWPAELANPRLKRVFDDDPHVNVCGAAVDVATELGTDELLGSLAELRNRFANDQFLVFAVDIACSRIRSSVERDI
jgi:HEAT repeat protein